MTPSGKCIALCAHKKTAPCPIMAACGHEPATASTRTSNPASPNPTPAQNSPPVRVAAYRPWPYAAQPTFSINSGGPQLGVFWSSGEDSHTRNQRIGRTGPNAGSVNTRPSNDYHAQSNPAPSQMLWGEHLQARQSLRSIKATRPKATRARWVVIAHRIGLENL